MTYPIYLIFLALSPSIIWLLYFLRKDVHPESNRMVLKIFFYGMLAALPAALIEAGFQSISSQIAPFNSGWQYLLVSILNVFLGVALIEELLKYLVVKEKVVSHSELDEPIDVMLYMIISALGFATLENIFIFLSPEIFLSSMGETFALASFRFISATFLHALASGTVGFFLALSFFEMKKRGLFLFLGLGIAVFLHGLYNFSIMKIEGDLRLGIPIIILISLAFFVSFGFQRLKKLKSICKIY